VLFADLLGTNTVEDYVRALVAKNECRTALDIGCGDQSCLTRFRPQLVTAGIDVHLPSLEKCRAHNFHDFYIHADVIKDALPTILAQFNGVKFDLVTIIGVIEHLPKPEGHRLLERCEQLTSKYLVVETPNGFIDQGPEDGNEYQRHLSGWFPHDFEGYGCTVHGTTGTKYLRGYMAGPKYDFVGAGICDILLTRLLRAHTHPTHAFNLVAIKDVRGVAARNSPAGQSSRE
jgi:Methyltransferase domain